jgi:hypothetical protein
MRCLPAAIVAISFTYSEFVFVALDIQLAKRMRHIVICGLSGYTIFFSTLSINGTIFGGGVIHIKCVFDFLYNFRLKYFSFQEEFSGILSSMHIGLHVKYTLFLSNFNGT